MPRVVPWNVDREGIAKTVLAGYYKYGVQTLLGENYGTSGTVVLEVYEDGSDTAGEVLPEQPDGR